MRIAIKNGNVQVLKFLVQLGVDSELKNEALMIACFYGMLEIVEFLVENAADLHAEDHDGSSALN